jgi:hypothetical protein
MKFSQEVNDMHGMLMLMMTQYMGFSICTHGIVLDLWLSDVLKFPVKFWKMVFDNVCDKLNICRFSKKAIDNFYCNISKDTISTMNKTTIIEKFLNKVYIYSDNI